MRKREALRRKTQRTAGAFVASLCVLACSIVQAQSVENKLLKDFEVTPGGVVKIEGKADLAEIAATAEAAKAKRAEARAKAGGTRSLAQNKRALETRAVFYPTELAWGDAGYFASVERNIADETQKIYAPFDYELGKYWDLGDIKITAAGIPGEYVYANELAFGKDKKRNGFRGDFVTMRNETVEIAPGEERFRSRTALEFPPLEDANDPFWKAVRERLEEEGRVVLQLSVQFERFENSLAQRRDVFETKVFLNKRGVSEMETLDAWREKTPQNLTPNLEDGERYKRPRPKESGAAGTLRGSEKSFISLNGETYDSWAFARVGNRKPGDPNNPTTLEGWRDLENVFETGTLRDEITFVRLQLEYYTASQGEKTTAALETLLAWLAARPEAQRAVLAASVVSKSAFFKGKGLEGKYRALTEAVEKSVDRWGPSYERFRKEEAPFGEATSQIFEPFPPRQEPFAIETRNVVWPQEAFFGDAVYFAAIDRNVSSTLGGAWSVHNMEYLKRHFASAVVVEAEGIDAKHRFFHEFNPFDTIAPRPEDPKTLLPPDAERTYAQFAIEFPPLEDWNDVFWTAVREKLAAEKRVVLHIKLSYWRGGAQWDTVESDIVLKPRPEKEMELISSWRDATPSDLLPERVGQHTLKETPRSDDYSQIARSGFEAIALDGSDENFSPWLFARVGNRKPGDPNNPTTLDGWRELENKFAPSTLRDEITFVRLQLEYYAASQGAETEAASKALLAWLTARPEAQ
ncbi:MAG: hypothetical protein IJO40_02580, partial [Thermoguttaceae bacterium]|nr:hypothetical protein [Thermoguttaceae bacterium]